MESELKSAWHELGKALPAPADWVTAVWKELEDNYGSPDRAYHNFTHLNSMFGAAAELADQVADPQAIQLAIWFHDIVYDFTAKDNEERSADYAVECLKEIGFDPNRIAAVEEMIHRSKNHFHNDPNESFDLQVFLDCDLLILGAGEKDYAVYMKQIRKEYSWVPGWKYRLGRAMVLKNYASLPRIFRTEHFRNQHEERAYINLNTEIRKLSRFPFGIMRFFAERRNRSRK